ncbi:GntR family transcriptional regulator [Virgibacillus sp. C22-A2]|uniref:GntR family transcriptional regulator n=1 Tax=Virgibacillus tibetensis TaxID=3042313 RepID=A0ABU6KDW7_9BACI|nr:GntR family transcriptional regulator [Virgibacillus sp. C22-A2]
MVLEYNNSIPLYVQLKAKIEEKILNGTYTVKIPSEREIIDEFYVSRSTVRQAIKELVDEGVLSRRPGKGTFISLKPIDDWLGNLSSTSETIGKMGMEPGAKLLKAEESALSPHLQQITGLTSAFHIRRIRYADHIPIGIENSYYPVNLGKKLSQFNLNNITLYDVLELKLEVHTKEAEQVIRAGTVLRQDAALLDIPTKSTMLNVDRKLLDLNDNFVEFEQAYYRADMYSFKINLAKKNNRP